MLLKTGFAFIYLFIYLFLGGGRGQLVFMLIGWCTANKLITLFAHGQSTFEQMTYMVQVAKNENMWASEVCFACLIRNVSMDSLFRTYKIICKQTHMPAAQ